MTPVPTLTLCEARLLLDALQLWWCAGQLSCISVGNRCCPPGWMSASMSALLSNIVWAAGLAAPISPCLNNDSTNNVSHCEGGIQGAIVCTMHNVNQTFYCLGFPNTQRRWPTELVSVKVLCTLEAECMSRSFELQPSNAQRAWEGNLTGCQGHPVQRMRPVGPIPGPV